MTLTTIKVDSSVRDRLKALAAGRALSLGDYLDELADTAERAALFDRMRTDLRNTPAETLAEYRSETEQWQRLGGDGLE